MHVFYITILRRNCIDLKKRKMSATKMWPEFLHTTGLAGRLLLNLGNKTAETFESLSTASSGGDATNCDTKIGGVL